MKHSRLTERIISIAILISILSLFTTTYDKGKAYKVPYHITITMTQDPSSSVTLAWESEDTLLTSAVAQVVKKSESNGFLSLNTLTFNKGYVEVIKDRSYCKVEVTGLEPDIEYLFRCGDASGENWSGEGSFKTAFLENKPFTFLYISDLQIYSAKKDAIKTQKSLENAFNQFGENLAFIYNGGDFTDGGNKVSEWDTFFDISKGIYERTIVSPVMGNHDYKEGGYLDQHFPIPEASYNNTASNIPFVYAFDYGAAHFMALNLEYRNDNLLVEQMEWLKEQVNNSDKPWQIVLLHRAVYAGASHITDGSTIETRKLLAPLFDDLHIDVVLQGHDHVYCRGFVNGDGSKELALPLENNALDVFAPNAPLYYVSVTGGLRFYAQKDYEVTKGDPLLPNYEFLDLLNDNTYDAESEEGNKMTFSGITVTEDKITFDTYYTTTKTFEYKHLETFTLHNRNNLYKSLKEVISNPYLQIKSFVLYFIQNMK